MMEEIWKDIEGFEGLYQVSNLGRVKSLSRSVFMINYKRSVITNEKILKNNIGNVGYPRVSLFKSGISKQFCVHTLVANAFIPNPENLSDVNHIDGDRTNSNLNNLERVSRRENATHSILRRGINGSTLGVTFCKTQNKKNKWKSSIWINGRGHVFLGQFQTKEEASKAYQKALIDYKIKNKYAIV